MSYLNYLRTSSFKKWLLPLFFLGAFNFSYSVLYGENLTDFYMEERVVHGVVKDSNGEPLPGVNIIEKGTDNGTISALDGTFDLKLLKDKSILVFRYIGFESKEIEVKSKDNINVLLKEQTNDLDEVVVVGYGTMRKSDLTGSVSKVDMAKKANLVNTSVMQSLQGAIAGLNVGMTTGAGSMPSFSIRGTNSISAGNDPLIVVDGAIYYGSLGDFSPAEILSVDVLKDASSAAVYGSKAANGVILITTKMGQSQKPEVRLNSYIGVNVNSNKPKMLGPDKYIQKVLDWREAQGMQADPERIEEYLNPIEAQNYSQGKTIDAYDEVLQTGLVQNYDLSYSGKSNNVNYFASINYNNQKGVVIGDDYSRYSIRLNLESKATNWLKLGFKLNFSQSDYSGAMADLTQAAYMSPFASLYDDEGNMIRYPMDDQIAVHPLASYKQKQDKDIRKSFFGVYYGEVDFPFLKGLKYKLNISQNNRWSHVAEFWDENSYTGESFNGKGNQNRGEATSLLIDNILTFDRLFGKHYINTTLLYSYENNKGESLIGSSQDFASGALGWNALQSGKVQAVSTSAYEDNSISQMARIHYGYDNKYLATFTIRRDGYSGFGKNNKFGLFPSFAVSYVMSREKFMQNVSVVNNLKFRASYGLNGNQSLGRYKSLASLGFSRYIYGNESVITSFPSSMGNSELGWESTKTANFGIDLSLFNYRLSATIDVYFSKSKDLLLQQSLPYMTGFANVWSNIGQVRNRGVEFTLNSVNIQNKNFKWTSDLVFSLNRNKIVSLYGKDSDSDGVEDDDIGNNWFIGESIGAIFGYEPDGIYQIGDEIPEGFKPGYFKIKDVDGVEGISLDDRHVYANSEPNFRLSLNNNFSYKNFTLSVMLNSVIGGNGYYMADNSYALNPNANFPGRVNMVDIPYWTPSRPSNEYPIINYTPGYGHAFLQSRSFVRLQDLSLSYSLPNKFLKNINISSAQVYASGKNLFVLTDWIGYDPETAQSVMSAVPSMRSFVFGVNVSF